MYTHYASRLLEQKTVVIYARVSTEHEAQLSALENQVDWYDQILALHPEWTVAERYIDEGITGTSATKRPEFMRMIKDAEEGKFDMILTREVARFARNTIDTLHYTRMLKKKGIEIYFINDGIRTFDGDGELRLTIMATLAQDESRKTSVRVKSGQQISMNKGVFYGNGNILGYDRKGKDLVINPEQAMTVKMIFDWYLQGWGIKKIQIELEAHGRKTAMGKTTWSCTTLSYILQNTFYYGVITYHKEYTPDFLEQKKITNRGEVEYTQVRGTHEPIISEEDFFKVQKIMNSRRQKISKRTEASVGKRCSDNAWVRILKCECGCNFNRKVWHRKQNEIQYGFQCYAQIRKGSPRERMKKGLSMDGVCKSSMIPEWKLQMMAKYIFAHFVQDTEEICNLAISMLEQHINDKEEKKPIVDVESTRAMIEAEIEKLTNRLDNLIEMRADGEISKEVFQKKKIEIDAAIAKLRMSLPDTPEKADEQPKEDVSEKIERLRNALRQSVRIKETEDIPERILEAFIEKIIVSENEFQWFLRGKTSEEPLKCTVEGRKGNAKISSLGIEQHRRHSLSNSVRKSMIIRSSSFGDCSFLRGKF